VTLQARRSVHPGAGRRTNSRSTAGVALGSALVGLLTAGCTMFGPSARDPGDPQTQTRTVSAVSAVDLAAAGELVLTAGSTPSLHITAGRNVLPHLTSDIQGDRLTLGHDGSTGDLGLVHYDLVLPAAQVVELSGAGTVRVTATRTLQKVLLPGSGIVRAEGLSTEELTVDLPGSGQITVAGSATRQRITISGSGRYSAAGLTSEDADVTISGSGSADVEARHTLTATVSGNGAITYTGDATVTSSITGHGTVVHR